jgi:methylmalonyl-CoA/ethylmalonyl-CoA epimerase
LINNGMVLDHVTIAVKDIERSSVLFNLLFQEKLLKRIELHEQRAEAVFYLVGEVVVGLETSNDPNSDIYKFLQRKGEGLHHLGYNVSDLTEVKKKLLSENVTIITQTVKPGYKKELFVHPKDYLGTLLQLMEWEEPYRSSLQKRIDILGDI